MGFEKFGRNYKLFVEYADGSTVQIEPPFTLQFSITRNTLDSSNVGRFNIYNLKETTRNKLRKDQDDFDPANRRSIYLQAGYGDRTPEVFRGNIYKGFSVRQGSDFVTTLECFDGGLAFVNSTFSKAFPKNTLQRSILKEMINIMQAEGLTVGAIGDFAGQLARGNSFDGRTKDLLTELSGGAFFVDKEKAYLLKDNEVLDVGIFKITPSSGLLNTPTREYRFINLEMIFEPHITVGQRVQVESFTDSDNFNGLYKVNSVQHAGIISPAVGGRLVSTFGMQPGTFIPVAPERR